MRSFQKSGRLRYVIQSKLFLIFLGIIILAFLFNIFSFMNKMGETSKNKETIEDKVTELEKSKEKLNFEIIKLKTEKGIEENIREKFGLAKKGEEMIVIIEDKSSEEAEKKTDSEGFFSFFKNWFK